MLLTLLFAIGLAGPDLRLELVRESLTGTHYRYRQHIDGQPVLGGEVNVTVRHSGAREAHRALAMPPFGPRFKSAGTSWVNAGGIARQAMRIVVSDGMLPAVRYVDVETGHVLREDQLYWNG